MPALESTSDQKYQHQLPTVVFRVVDDKALTVPAGVSSVSWHGCDIVARADL
jgi:hypothetical protein